MMSCSQYMRGAAFTLGVACIGAMISCAAESQYDEEPAFVEKMRILKAEGLKRTEQRSAQPSDVPIVPPPGGAALELTQPSELPAWFKNPDRQLLREAKEKRSLMLDDLFVLALKHSRQIQVFSDLPLIRETGIREAQGAFDVRAFIESAYDHVNEPIGNALISSTIDRLNETEVSMEVGLRKKLMSGAEISIAQRLANTASNADFFVPERQAASTLTLRLVQPLQSGSGVRYNSSVVHLARLDSQIAEHEYVRQVEAHLLEIARSYWSLYTARAVYSMYLSQTETIRGIVVELKARANADALVHEILRAESSLWSHRANLVRAEMAIHNAQKRLHAMVNEDVDWNRLEIIPNSPVFSQPFSLDATRHAARITLEKRPEIKQAFLQLRAAAVRLGMAENEVLPRFNLILEGRLAGLGEGWAFDEASRDQGDVQEVGGTVGVLYEVPLGNNAAQARLLRRKIEMRQQVNQVRTVVDTVLLEVDIVERELEVGWRDFVAKSEAARAARQEVEHLLSRRDLAAARAPASTYILDLMGAHDRQMEAERALAQAVGVYQVTVLNLQRSQGTLLEYTSIAPTRSLEGDLPVIRMQKRPSPPLETGP